jgi:hypothetical protein
MMPWPVAQNIDPSRVALQWHPLPVQGEVVEHGVAHVPLLSRMVPDGQETQVPSTHLWLELQHVVEA